MRNTLAALLFLPLAAVAQTYTSPFAISGFTPQPSWATELQTRQTLIYDYSTPAPNDWYSSSWPAGSYGPLMPQLFSSASSPNLINDDRGQGVFNAAPLTPDPLVPTATSMRERLIYVAQSYIGTAYQHIHMPTFNPALVTQPGGYPWIPVSTNTVLQTTQQLGTGNRTDIPNPYLSTYGIPAPGIDCTDFSALVYNLALGIQMHSGTMNQLTFPGHNASGTATADVLGPTGETLTPNFLYGPNYGTTTINQPGSLDATLADLEPGDLLYMQGDLQIKHVVIWLGEYGTNADGTPPSVPLIISSHDNTPAIFDVNGTDQIDLVTGLPTAMLPDGSNATEFLPPPGVQILPFTPDTWFYQNFTVAMQVVPEPSTAVLAGFGLLALFGLLRRKKS
ncbi:MAG: PEP-CTERM sorting domain-containing protein [Verrucomicrobia bacterium]|nr:PEP-CTERM sorting domain-containing protein [Verrucomicrobiota bacterium]